MFDTERFVADCRAAFAADPSHKAIHEVVARAMSEPAAVFKGLGEPKRPESRALFHSKTLTILNDGQVAATSIAATPGLAAPFAFKGGTYPGTGGTCAGRLRFPLGSAPPGQVEARPSLLSGFVTKSSIVRPPDLPAFEPKKTEP